MKIDVLGSKVTVKRIKKLSSDTGNCGEYIFDKKIIHIDKDLKGKSNIHTLMHEMIHALCDKIGLENTSLSRDVEEILSDKIPEMFLENFDIKLKCKKKKKKGE